MHHPNTLHHNTAVNPIKTPYTAFNVGDSIPVYRQTAKARKTPVKRLYG